MKIIVSSTALKRVLREAIQKLPRSIYTFRFEDKTLHIHCYQLPIETPQKEAVEYWFSRKQIMRLISVLMLLQEQPISLGFGDDDWITITHASI